MKNRRFNIYILHASFKVSPHASFSRANDDTYGIGSNVTSNQTNL